MSRKRAATMCLCFAAIAIFVRPAEAQTQPVVDLGVIANTNPPGPLAHGDVAYVQLIFTNSGLDAASSVSAISVPYPFLKHELFSLVPSEPNPCPMFYDDFQAPPGSGQPSFLVAQVAVGAIAPGESRVCTVRLDVSATASGQFDLAFRVMNGHVGTTDTNTANDVATIALLFESATALLTAIPATGAHSAALLLLAVVLIGSVCLRSRREDSRLAPRHRFRDRTGISMVTCSDLAAGLDQLIIALSQTQTAPMNNVEALRPTSLHVSFGLFLDDTMILRGTFVIEHEAHTNTFEAQEPASNLINRLSVEHKFELPACSLTIEFSKNDADGTSTAIFGGAMRMGVHTSVDWESVNLAGYTFVFRTTAR